MLSVHKLNLTPYEVQFATEWYAQKKISLKNIYYRIYVQNYVEIFFPVNWKEKLNV
jgi:hypothetical protein